MALRNWAHARPTTQLRSTHERGAGCWLLPSASDHCGRELQGVVLVTCIVDQWVVLLRSRNVISTLCGAHWSVGRVTSATNMRGLLHIEAPLPGTPWAFGVQTLGRTACVAQAQPL